jgi:hypothetical protein
MFAVVVVVVRSLLIIFHFKNVRGGGPSTATEGLHARCDVITCRSALLGSDESVVVGDFL